MCAVIDNYLWMSGANYATHHQLTAGRLTTRMRLIAAESVAVGRQGRVNFICFLPLLLSLLLLLFDADASVDGVVVDGHKRKDLQATRKQSDARSMVDKFNTKTCGLSDKNQDEHEFVSMAREGQFPWMVSFQITTLNKLSKELRDKKASIDTSQLLNEAGGSEQQHSNNTEKEKKKVIDLHFCCGSFLSEKWILSAAHCFAASGTMNKYLRAGKLKAVAGSHKVSSRNPINLNLTIERIFTHANFDTKMPVGFDIALVELSDNSRVNFTLKRINGGPMDEQIRPFVNGICLPLKEKKYKTNETARIAGWGMSNEKDETSMPSKLLTTDILIKDKDECVKKYGESMKSDGPRKQSERYDDFLCASYKDSRDACQSDSGAPLMEYADGKAVVIGIVSYGIGCATRGVPGLYTRTSAYINWIKDIMEHGKGASVSFKLMEHNRSVSSDNNNNTSNENRSATTKQPNQLTGNGFKFFDQVHVK